MSPPRSLPSPGSAGSLYQTLATTSPSIVSPLLVSPASVINSLGEPSPAGTSPTNLPSGDMLNTGLGLANLPGPTKPVGTGIPMVQGYAGATRNVNSRITRLSTKNTRSRSQRRRADRAAVKEEDESDDGVSDHSGGALATHPLCVFRTYLCPDIDDRLPPYPTTVRAEHYRRARIESEQVSLSSCTQSGLPVAHDQRRRDELRVGFSRLRDALPPSNSRPSKAAILDRCESDS